MKTWLLIVVLAVGTVLLKTIGPLLAGGRQPPPALTRVIALIAPALISALIVAGTFTARPATGARCPRRGARGRRDLVVVPRACRSRPRARRDHLRSAPPRDLTANGVQPRKWSQTTSRRTKFMWLLTTCLWNRDTLGSHPSRVSDVPTRAMHSHRRGVSCE